MSADAGNASGRAEVLVGNLCQAICAACEDAAPRLEAVLKQAYHHARHDRYDAARSVLLLSAAATLSPKMALGTQVLHNRTVAQLGLAALRAGRLREALGHLHGLCNGGHTKELLGYGDGSTEYISWGASARDGDDSQRPWPVIPAHPGLTVELAEVAHLVCLALLEGPRLAARPLPIGAAGGGDGLAFLERELAALRVCDYEGPPESHRECALAAASQLRLGDWEACCGLVERSLSGIGMPVEQVRGPVMDALRGHVKVASLQAFLACASDVYPCFGLARLAAMFDLPEKRARAALNRSMLDGLVHGSWDETSSMVVMHAPPQAACRLHGIALELAGLAATVSAQTEHFWQLHLADESSSHEVRAPGVVPSAGRDGLRERQGGGRKGRNSRFRRHLVNLNRAVAKWIAKETSGQMTRADTLVRIAGSPAVQHLRSAGGDDFCEWSFVSQLIARGGGGPPL